MKKSIPYIIIAILVFFLFMKSCGKEKSEPKIIEVEVPEKSGSFEPKEPTYIKTDTAIEVKWKEKVIKVPSPVNDSLVNAYKALADSLNAAQAELARYKMYLDAIQIRDFTSHFEDEYLDLTISGKVQGHIKSIQPDYTIKSRTINDTINPVKTTFRVLAGLEFGNNTSFGDFRYKANIGFQNTKGNIFSLGYERWNGQDYIWVGYEFSVLSF